MIKFIQRFMRILIYIATGIKDPNDLNRVISNNKCDCHASFKTDKPNNGKRIITLSAAMGEIFKSG